MMPGWVRVDSLVATADLDAEIARLFAAGATNVCCKPKNNETASWWFVAAIVPEGPKG